MRTPKYNYEKVIDLVVNDKKSVREIESITNIPSTMLRQYLKKCNIKLNKCPNFTKYKVNHNYLDNIDSEDKAYFLGVMFSDGYISGNTVGLCLKKSDKKLVDLLFDKICSGYKSNVINNSYARSFTSEKIVKKLIELGCVYNKTYSNFKIPLINKNLISHFIRGYFDGDGSISFIKNKKYINCYICSIGKNIILDFQITLTELNIESNIFLEKREGILLKIPSGIGYSTNCKDMFRLVIGTHVNLLKFYEYIYKNATIYLERKFILFNEYYVNTVLTLEKKGSKAVQRIEDETFIDFEKLKTFCFWSWKEVPNMENIRKMHYDDGISMNKIGKLLNYDRTSLKDRLIKYMKEYNSSKSVQTLT